VIDDVHFLADKAATQSEFLHTLDALDLAGAQVALASDEHPRLIRKFGQSLVSRMLAGMVVRVETPDPGTRLTLAERLSLRRGLRLAPEASTVISERCVGGAREIEGILSRVDAMRAVTSVTGPVSAGEVRAIFQQDDAQRGTQPVRLPEILATTCQHLGVEPDQLRGGGRHRRVALARGLVAWLARDLTAMSFPEIARGLGREAHSAVHGACARVQSLLDADARVDAGPAGEVAVRELTARLRHTLRGTSRG
jgi:chromosomal replication initiator protein